MANLQEPIIPSRQAEIFNAKLPPVELPDTEEETTPAEEHKESNFVVNVKLTDKIEARIKEIFKEEMSLVQKERQDMYNGKGLEQQITNNQKLYDGIVDPPQTTWKSANYHIWLTTMMVDVATIKAKKQTLSSNPMIILEPSDEFTTNELKYDLRNREDKLDFKLRKQIEIEKLLHSIYQKTFLHATSFVKVPMCNDIEWAVYKEYYSVSPDELKQFVEEEKPIGDIKRFIDDFPDYTVDPTEQKNFTKLITEGSVTVTIEEKQQIYYGVKPYLIPLERCWLRPKIKELERQRMIAEEIDFVWSDMQKRFETEYYLKNKRQELIDKTSNENYTKDDYTVFECRFFCDLEGNGKLMRYWATIDKKTETILRCVYAPLKGKRKIDIVPFYIMPSADSCYGIAGFGERMADPNKMVDNSWNTIFNSFIFSHNPVIVTDDKELNFTATDYGPLAMMRVSSGKKVQALELTHPKIETVAITQMAERFSEFGTGVSTAQSGRESIADPNAPMGKTAMLLDRSDRRLEDYIKELHLCFSILAEMVEKTELQFNPDDYDFLTDGYTKNINKLIYSKNVRYTTPVLTLDKETDLRLLTGFIQLLIAYYPEKMQNPEIRYNILKCVIDNTGGSIERIKDIVNLSPEEEQKKILKGVLKELIESVATGDEAKIQQVMAMMGQGGGQPPSPEAPTGPPAPVSPPAGAGGQ